VKAIHACLAILLAVRPVLQYICRYPCDVQANQAAKGAIASHEALIDLLESIEHFLSHLDIYTQVPPTPSLDEIVVNILVELFSTLALATRELKQGRSGKSVLAGVVPY
jgi:vesicle coat complex subunit